MSFDSGRKLKWGDAAVEGDDYNHEYEFQPYETSVDENGVKSSVEYKLREDGTRAKITRKIKVSKAVKRVNKRVEERKQWRKFGECAGKPPGPESGFTMYEEVALDTALSKTIEKFDKDSVQFGIVCRHCNAVGDHWSNKCPYKDRLVSSATGTARRDGADSDPGKPAKYVPPGAKNPRWLDSAEQPKRQSDDATVRVTNLSEDTRESDIEELFSRFGPYKRIFLAKDRITGNTKGYAFVTYHRREDAANAIEALSGYGYNHLILHLEWAKPRTEFDKGGE